MMDRQEVFYYTILLLALFTGLSDEAAAICSSTTNPWTQINEAKYCTSYFDFGKGLFLWNQSKQECITKCSYLLPYNTTIRPYNMSSLIQEGIIEPELRYWVNGFNATCSSIGLETNGQVTYTAIDECSATKYYIVCMAPSGTNCGSPYNTTHAALEPVPSPQWPLMPSCYIPGLKMKYTRHDGASFPGGFSGVITCNGTSGTWKPDNYESLLLVCTDVPVVGNASVRQDPGRHVFYTCDIGYMKEGPDNVTCNMTTGNWSSLPKCKPYGSGTVFHLQSDQLPYASLRFPILSCGIRYGFTLCFWLQGDFENNTTLISVGPEDSVENVISLFIEDDRIMVALNDSTWETSVGLDKLQDKKWHEICLLLNQTTGQTNLTFDRLLQNENTWNTTWTISLTSTYNYTWFIFGNTSTSKGGYNITRINIWDHDLCIFDILNLTCFSEGNLFNLSLSTNSSRSVNITGDVVPLHDAFCKDCHESFSNFSELNIITDFGRYDEYNGTLFFTIPGYSFSKVSIACEDGYVLKGRGESMCDVYTGKWSILPSCIDWTMTETHIVEINGIPGSTVIEAPLGSTFTISLWLQTNHVGEMEFFSLLKHVDGRNMNLFGLTLLGNGDIAIGNLHNQTVHTNIKVLTDTKWHNIMLSLNSSDSSTQVGLIVDGSATSKTNVSLNMLQRERNSTDAIVEMSSYIGNITELYIFHGEPDEHSLPFRCDNITHHDHDVFFFSWRESNHTSQLHLNNHVIHHQVDNLRLCLSSPSTINATELAMTYSQLLGYSDVTSIAAHELYSSTSISIQQSLSQPAHIDSVTISFTVASNDNSHISSEPMTQMLSENYVTQISTSELVSRLSTHMTSLFETSTSPYSNGSSEQKTDLPIETISSTPPLMYLSSSHQSSSVMTVSQISASVTSSMSSNYLTLSSTVSSTSHHSSSSVSLYRTTPTTVPCHSKEYIEEKMKRIMILYDDGYKCPIGTRLLTLNGTIANDNTTEICDIQCVVLDCGPPPVVINASYRDDITNFSFGNSVTYSCNPGLDYQGGTHVRFCSSNSQWNGTDLNCKDTQALLKSIKDRRPIAVEAPYAAVVGGIPLGVCCGIIGIIVLLDFDKVYRYFRGKAKKLKSKKRKRRGIK